MLAIDRSLLATVTGGADPRNAVVLDGLDKKFGRDGVVSLIGQPKYTGARVAGRFDVNALEGGDTKYSFNATLAAGGHLTHIHRQVTGAE